MTQPINDRPVMKQVLEKFSEIKFYLLDKGYHLNKNIYRDEPLENEYVIRNFDGSNVLGHTHILFNIRGRIIDINQNTEIEYLKSKINWAIKMPESDSLLEKSESIRKENKKLEDELQKEIDWHWELHEKKYKELEKLVEKNDKKFNTAYDIYSKQYEKEQKLLK